MKKEIAFLVVLVVLVSITNSIFSQEKASYNKLCSANFVDQYNNKIVTFKALFLGEWTMSSAYDLMGIKTKDRVFINHRDTLYKTTDTGLGSSDMVFPGFPMSIEKSKSDIVYDVLKKGDIIEVIGTAKKVNGSIGRAATLQILISEIKKNSK